MLNYSELRKLRKQGVFGPTIRSNNQSGVILAICGLAGLLAILIAILAGCVRYV